MNTVIIAAAAVRRFAAQVGFIVREPNSPKRLSALRIGVLVAVSASGLLAGVSLSRPSCDSFAVTAFWGGLALIGVGLAVLLFQVFLQKQTGGGRFFSSTFIQLFVIAYVALAFWYYHEFEAAIGYLWPVNVRMQRLLAGLAFGSVFAFLGLVLARKPSWIGAIGCWLIWCAVVADVSNQAHQAPRW
jgi:hypothetical protein